MVSQLRIVFLFDISQKFIEICLKYLFSKIFCKLFLGMGFEKKIFQSKIDRKGDFFLREIFLRDEIASSIDNVRQISIFSEDISAIEVFYDFVHFPP